MLASRSLSVRLGMAFGALVALTLVLGAASIAVLRSTAATAGRLSGQQVPETRTATALREHAQECLYGMRGYVMSEKESYFEVCTKNLALAQADAADLAKLTSGLPALAAVNKSSAEIGDMLAQYDKWVQQTKTIMQSMQAARGKAVAALDAYLKAADTLVSASAGDTGRMAAAQRVQQLGSAARGAVFESRATLKPEAMDKAAKALDQVPGLLGPLAGLSGAAEVGA